MEKLLTKYFWVFNLGSVLTMSYFLASGTGELVASKVTAMVPAMELADAPRARPRRPARSAQSDPDGSKILERNMFDSETGPISDAPLAGSFLDSSEDPTASGDLPLIPCSSSSVKILATVADKNYQEWSFASINESGKPRLARVGDQVDNRTVTGITWRYLFLRGSSDECFIDLFGDEKNVPIRRRSARTSDDQAPENDFKDGVQVISETERVVDRSLVDTVLRDPSSFIRSVRVRPHKQNGKVVGFKLRRFQANSPLALLGAKRGDVIHAVNGAHITSVDQALGAYQSLRSASDLTFSITRRGKPMDLTIRVR